MPVLSASEFEARATAVGLTRVWVVARGAIDPAFPPERQATPATLRPDYRQALVLASAGPAFWRRCRAAASASSGVAQPEPDPLDRQSERDVEALAALVRRDDPGAIAVYPFRHPRQLLGFTGLLGSAPWLGATPFGVQVEPTLGPWWALRGALLTRLDWPARPPAGASPCTACPAPCIAACPAGAVAKRGLDWRACADFRLGGPTCRETCLARLACPVAPELRYDPDAIAHHYRASLREIEAMRKA